ncbi:hypothetical protein B0T24DRAFT_692772 [Lasiosphaeria ovina]|uniref:Uncharacterized protein n=1 Tax=Lasiosphaeria ovina TaxID=92902 RepID=A0AAE0JS38_9PEZI|nr:hypothetical protein B0T24DRAFT_692772 [Lasiosphaeria ovina]
MPGTTATMPAATMPSSGHARSGSDGPQCLGRRHVGSDLATLPTITAATIGRTGYPSVSSLSSSSDDEDDGDRRRTQTTVLARAGFHVLLVRAATPSMSVFMRSDTRVPRQHGRLDEDSAAQALLASYPPFHFYCKACFYAQLLTPGEGAGGREPTNDRGTPRPEHKRKHPDSYDDRNSKHRRLDDQRRGIDSKRDKKTRKEKEKPKISP